MLFTIIVLATIILHLGVGTVIALHGRLFVAALVSTMIALLPVACSAAFGSPQQVEEFAVFFTPLIAISFFVAVAGAVTALGRWVRKTKSGSV